MTSIAGIEDRLNRATEQAEAPWRVERLGSITPWTGALSIGYGPAQGCSHLAHTTRGFEGDGTDGDSSAQAIAAFIANAPTDVLYLLSQLRAQKERIEELEGVLRQVETILLPAKHTNDLSSNGKEIMRIIAATLTKGEGK